MGSRLQGSIEPGSMPRAAPVLRHAGHDLDPEPSLSAASSPTSTAACAASPAMRSTAWGSSRSRGSTPRRWSSSRSACELRTAEVPVTLPQGPRGPAVATTSGRAGSRRCTPRGSTCARCSSTAPTSSCSSPASCCSRSGCCSRCRSASARSRSARSRSPCTGCSSAWRCRCWGCRASTSAAWRTSFLDYTGREHGSGGGACSGTPARCWPARRCSRSGSCWRQRAPSTTSTDGSRCRRPSARSTTSPSPALLFMIIGFIDVLLHAAAARVEPSRCDTARHATRCRTGSRSGSPGRLSATCYLAETVKRFSTGSTSTRSRRVAEGLAGVRERGGRLFILGVGGSAGHAVARGQRLPQDLRLRGVRADRQRLRADRPRQRRGLGHHVLRVARRARGSAPTTRCWSSRSAAATRAKGVSVNLVARARARRRGRRADLRHRRPRRRLHGRRSPTRCVVIPPLYADRITPHTEGLCAVVWHLLVTPPGAASVGHTKWESTAK